MDNKLSELSKPVAYVFDHGVMGAGDFSYGTPQMHSTAKDENARPLYSQEYVSALDEVAQYWIGQSAEWKQRAEAAEAKAEALLAELEAKDKRITTVTEEREFWRERVEGAEKEREEFRRRFNLERTYTEDADKRIAELERKLATPVRLPKRWDISGQVNPPRIVQVQFEQQNRTLDQCAESIRAAGFTVGDE